MLVLRHGDEGSGRRKDFGYGIECTEEQGDEDL
jgi:hypothetical protein